MHVSRQDQEALIAAVIRHAQIVEVEEKSCLLGNGLTQLFQQGVSAVPIPSVQHADSAVNTTQEFSFVDTPTQNHQTKAGPEHYSITPRSV